MQNEIKDVELIHSVKHVVNCISVKFIYLLHKRQNTLFTQLHNMRHCIYLVS